MDLKKHQEIENFPRPFIQLEFPFSSLCLSFESKDDKLERKQYKLPISYQIKALNSMSHMKMPLKLMGMMILKCQLN